VARRRATRAPDVRFRWQGLSAETEAILDHQGEADRFEFKREPDAVTTRVLVAAANAAVLEGMGAVTILVGVDEFRDPDTGAVRGIVAGLKNLEKHKQAIVSRSSETLPVPVAMTVYEENLGTTKPILRLVVTPTRPPHYDRLGARVTRQGASHRAITDDELLDLYLRREAEAFRERFGNVASRLEAHLQDVADDMARVSSSMNDDLYRVHNLAEEAAGASEESFAFLQGLDEAIGRIESTLDGIAKSTSTVEEAWWELRSVRERAVMYFGLRVQPAAKAVAVLRRVLAKTPDPAKYLLVAAELRAWHRFLDVPRNAPASRWLDAARAVEAAQQRGFDDAAGARFLQEALEHKFFLRQDRTASPTYPAKDLLGDP
jgi:hypothetical protein